MNGLPKGWELTSIGEICTLFNGRAFKPKEWTDIGLPIIRIQNLNNPKAKFNHFDGILNDRHLVVPGTLLFAWSGTPGTSFGAHEWEGENAALNQHIFKISFDEESINKSFFKYAINQKLNQLIGNAQGAVGLRHVTKSTFTSTNIVFPPLNEQVRIADKLDGLLARVDTAQAHLENIPIQLKRFRQSVLAAAVSERELQKESGSFRSSISIGELAKEIKYGTSKKCAYDSGETPVLRIPNMKNGKIDLSDLKYADFDDKELKKLTLEENDILIIRSNGSLDLVGKASLVSNKDTHCLFAGYLIRVRLDQRQVIPKFALLCLQSPKVRGIIELNARSTSGINNINSQEISSLRIPLPSMKEQQEIVNQVESLFVLADSVEKQYIAAKVRINRLTQSILAKTFRGELVPQDPMDEPASELLKRIKELKASELISSKKVVKQRAMKTKAIVMTIDKAPKDYLYRLLEKNGNEAHPEVLWKLSGLSIDAFYAKLKEELKEQSIDEDKDSPDPSLRVLKITKPILVGE